MLNVPNIILPNKWQLHIERTVVWLVPNNMRVKAIQPVPKPVRTEPKTVVTNALKKCTSKNTISCYS